MFKNTLYSILFGLAMEFQINVLLERNPGLMFGVFLLYGFIGALTYYTVPFIIQRFKNKKRGFWFALTVHGLAGLLIIEWGFMNHSPSHFPPWLLPIAQTGMFVWWATIAVMPYIIRHPLMVSYRKMIFWYYGVYAVISTVLTIPYGMAPVILLEPPVYLGFFYFYIKFASLLRNSME